MSKSRIGLDKIKESKGRTNWATLRTQVDAQNTRQHYGQS